MKILVAGGAGFIGSGFVELALRQGHEAVVLDALTYAGHRENLADLSCAFVHGDIRDGRRVLELLQTHSIDWLVNFAAESHVDRSIDAPAAFIETNIGGTFALLNAALDHYRALSADAQGRFRFLQISTDEIFGSLGAAGKFSETTPLAPNSPYSASKAAGDHLVRAWHRTYGLPTLVTHCSNNYGPRQFPEKLIPFMIHCALQDRALPVYGDGRNVRDWIHVEDHCAGLLLALASGQPGQSYCFGGDSERENLQVIQGICQALDQLKPRTDGQSHATRIEFVKDRPGHDRRYAIDDSRARRELGFRRRHASFESGLFETVQWYLAHQDWAKAVLSRKNV